MSGTVALWGLLSLVKSVQAGTIALGGAVSATGTIAAVNLAHALVFNLGNTAPSLNISAAQIRLALTNETTVTATVGGAAGAQVGSFVVVEFYPGVLKSVQRGTVTLTGVVSNTAAITAVNRDRAFMTCLGLNTNSANIDEGMGGGVLTDDTTVTVTKTTAASQLIYGFQIVEFF